jgi:predicted lipid-binding transport protein (Tim44 family)
MLANNSANDGRAFLNPAGETECSQHRACELPQFRDHDQAGAAVTGPGTLPAGRYVARDRAATAQVVHTGSMGRIIGTILGAILAIWLVFAAVGGILATLKTFLVIGLIVAAVFIVIWFLAGRPHRS